MANWSICTGTYILTHKNFKFGEICESNIFCSSFHLGVRDFFFFFLGI